MKVIGIHGRACSPAHNPAAVAVENGEILFAIEEERLVRYKYSYGLFPMNAVNECLTFCNWDISDIDFWAVGWDYLMGETPEAKKEITAKVFPKILLDLIPLEKIILVNHHVAHLMSSYILTPQKSAAGLIIDGNGENISVSIFDIENEQYSLISGVNIKDSPGLYYEAVAEYCGLGYMASGKLMGLASYGKPFDERIYRIDGCLREAQEVQNFPVSRMENLEVYPEWQEILEGVAYPYQNSVHDEKAMAYINVAATAQRDLEESVMELAISAKDKTGKSTLICGGGVFLNCNVNTKLFTESGFEEIVIHPAANDAGASLGAALEVCRINNIPPKYINEPDMGLGKSYPLNDTINVLKSFNLNIESDDREEALELSASWLSNNGILFFFWGRSEFGPRALCHRSILASPQRHDMLLELNKLKKREYWRPLAPVLLESNYNEVFETPKSDIMKYMLATAKVRSEYRKKISTVVHIDNTSRPQLVPDNIPHPISRLLQQFNKRTGLSCLVNTSMNVKGQPICERPLDAVNLMMSFSDNTAIFIDGVFATKNST
jgi:carbamoyltransferase